MKSNTPSGIRLAALALIGVAALGGALWYRHRVLTSTTVRLAKALESPQYRQVRAEVERKVAAVQAAPNDVKARAQLAQTYEKLGLLDLEEEQLARIHALAPDDHDAALGLAACRLALGKKEAAEAAYREVTQKWPNRAEGWQGLAATLHKEGRYTEAAVAVQKALAIDPHDPNSRFILDVCRLDYAGQFPSSDIYARYVRLAQQDLQTLLPVWPVPGEIEFRLGRAAALLGTHREAAEHYRKAGQVFGDRPDLMVDMVKEYMAAGDRAEARKVVDGAIARGLHYAPLYDLQGQLLQTASDPDAAKKALASFAAAVRLAPKNPYVQEHYGSACVRAGKLQDARAAFEASALINPERAFPYQQLSAIYTRLGDTARATAAARMATQMVFNDQQLRHLEQLGAAHPDAVPLQLILADRYRDLKMYGAARDKYLLILRLDPKNKRALDGIEAVKKATEVAQGN